MNLPPSLVLYEGPSSLDGAPIVVIATGIGKASKNAKTGALVQTWILRSDVAPHAAVKSGEDASVCGDCPQRPSVGGACYVRTFQAPLSVWKAYKRGSYRRATGAEIDALGQSYDVRAGSYGDPAAVPGWVWALARPVTGYTHQWRDERFVTLQAFAMASCETPEDLRDARAAGWRSFRVLATGEAFEPGEIECPSDSRGLSCEDCQLCQGTARQAADIGIRVHGALSKRYDDNRALRVL